MTKREPTCTYGFLVRKVVFAECPAVEVRILRRQPGEAYPTNCDGDGERKYARSPRRVHGLHFYDLQIIQWNSGAGTKSAYVSLPTIWYRDAGIIGLKRAEGQARTLRRLANALDKADARDLGAVIEVVAKVIGATWHAIPNGRYSYYHDTSWQFSGIDSAVQTARSIVSTFEVSREDAA